MRVEKAVRLLYGRFFYRFPNGESAADVYDRITGACSSSPPPPPLPLPVLLLLLSLNLSLLDLIFLFTSD